MTKKRNVRDLLVGERVHLFDGPYGCCTVQSVSDQEVVLVRPYVVTAGYRIGSFPKGVHVSTSIGIETVRLPFDRSTPVEVYEESYPGPVECASWGQAYELAAELERCTGRRQRLAQEKDATRIYVLPAR